MSNAKSDQKWVIGQAHDDIVTIGDPALTRPVIPFTEFGPSNGLFAHMVTRLRQLNGAGLAAPQIGQSVAAAVIEVRKTDAFPNRPESPLIMMANPEIIAQSGELEEDWEGCFSVPGVLGRVPRHNKITIRFQTPEGDHHEEVYSGYLARVVQHEVDHLHATEFIDRMSSLQSLTTVQNYLRFHR